MTLIFWCGKHWRLLKLNIGGISNLPAGIRESLYFVEKKTLHFSTFFFQEEIDIPWNFLGNMTDSGHFERISKHSFYYRIIRVDFDRVFIGFDFNCHFFNRLYIFSVNTFVNILNGTWMVFAIFQSCSYQTQQTQGLVYNIIKLNGGHVFHKNSNTKTHPSFISLTIYYSVRFTQFEIGLLTHDSCTFSYSCKRSLRRHFSVKLSNV